ncbi:MAG: hypothetical protein HYV07_19670 [Deltaproteobacteria bacterium]|nr:hypothetical protein [Deltaproteobacteria bacterium]
MTCPFRHGRTFGLTLLGLAALAGDSLVAAAAPELRIEALSSLQLTEGTPASLRFRIRGGRRARLFATRRPPGSRWNEDARTLRFTPDFIQGGDSPKLTLTATDGRARTSTTFSLQIADVIRPAPPEIIERSLEPGVERLLVRQHGDGFLEELGRQFDARVVIPTPASRVSPLPVRVYLHGVGDAPFMGGAGDEFRIYPHDPDTTYWVGRAVGPPGGTTLQPFTERRALALVEWVWRSYPGADRARTYLTGTSMGGSGALTIGLEHARHFAYVSADLAQTVPRNHRPFRARQLAQIWGEPGIRDDLGRDAWDARDLTSLVLSSVEARDQLVHLRFGKDDPTIHFGTFVSPSPVTNRSFFDALAEARMGARVVWDEGAHGPKDPRLGPDWWDRFDPIRDGGVRNDRVFIAFGASSLDQDPGRGGNGRVPYSAATGFAGKPEVAFDSGWEGDLAGQLGAYLRYSPGSVVDDIDELSFEVFLGERPILPPEAVVESACASVTPRRAQAFLLAPLEWVRFRIEGSSGFARADRSGVVTLPRVWLSSTPARVTLVRAGRGPRPAGLSAPRSGGGARSK